MEQKTGAVESLAAFVSRVHPGDRCVCCGKALLPVNSGSRAAKRIPVRVAARQQGAQGVECPHCGFEISEETAADCGADLSELHPAA